ncbi:SCO6880 family protein [Phytomonospora sp. NPDC050363]|uniref:SCO6880 family protein n=1 Tax=Phytomonospora sp. NPDC050363 TaxID=3155642 RepID=UPI0033C38294
MSDRSVRTYGGWRRSRGIGLFGLEQFQTVLVLAALTALLITVSVALPALIVVGPIAAIVLVLAIARWDGVTLVSMGRQRMRWLLGTSKGHHRYAGGLAGNGQHPWELPGVLAATHVVTASDASGEFGVVHHRRLGTLTVALDVAASAPWLVDDDQVDSWVANWGSWLAGLGHVPALSWVNVIVDTAPASGTRLADYVSTRMAPTAPAAARHLLSKLVAAAPSTAADVSTWVALTFDPSMFLSKPKNLEDSIAEVVQLLPGLQDALGGCGVSVLSRMDAAQLAGIVRAAFDPAARGAVTRALEDGSDRKDLSWQAAGPVAAEETWDYYRHESARSVSWYWHEAPRHNVTAYVLARLMAPSRHPKRVSLMYRPFTAAEAAKTVEREVNAADFRDALRAAQRRDEKARDRADRDRANRAAYEEAAGAGLGLTSMVVTTTVTSESDLPHAVAEVETLAEASKLLMRRAWGGNAALFAATLPLGICPPVLARTWPN